MLWTTKLHAKIAALEAEKALLSNDNERLRLDYERLRQDFNTIVAMLGNQAQARQTTRFDRDPFEEDPAQLDTYLSPAPGEFVDPETAIEALTDEAEEG